MPWTSALSLAFGADTYKLKFGHRGSNQPVKNLLTGRVHITSQNHGYAVDEESLKGLPLEVTHRAVNDGTVEVFAIKNYLFSQYSIIQKHRQVQMTIDIYLTNFGQCFRKGNN